jgi:hypothetical protein
MNANAATDTKTAEKNALISAAILAHKAAGLSTRESFDRVLGAGAFEKLAGEIYETLRNK